MEEKRYSRLDEEQGTDVCCEPVAEPMTDYSVPVSRRAGGGTEVHDRINDLDWDRLPILGPKTEEEALARIDKFEEELAKGQIKWVRIDDIHAELKKRHPWL